VADDADRLRDLARRQIETGAGRGTAHRIAFGALALYYDLVEGGRVGGGFGGSGGCDGAERDEHGNGQPLRLRGTEGGTDHADSCNGHARSAVIQESRRYG